jgi:hypothetical protein
MLLVLIASIAARVPARRTAQRKLVCKGSRYLRAYRCWRGFGRLSCGEQFIQI